jgi:hypothetical protein
MMTCQLRLPQVYEKPLLDAVEEGKPIIPKEKIDMIFGKVPEVCPSHCRQVAAKVAAVGCIRLVGTVGLHPQPATTSPVCSESTM